MNMLVTGGAGFIGSNFVRHWLGHHPADKVVVVDSLTYAGNLRNLEGVISDQRCKFFKTDIRDTNSIENILRQDRIDTVVHFAAESHVDRSISGPDEFIDTNIVGTLSLLKAARQVWQLEKAAVTAHRFHHISTDEVFGQLDSTEPAFTELTPYAPNSPYAASKASSDFLVRAYHHTYGLQVTTSNCSNNYGPYQFPEKLIPVVIKNAITGEKIPVYGDGRNVRDWIHVDDHSRGIELVLQNGTVGETYNLGGDCEYANIDIINVICSKIDEKFRANTDYSNRYPKCPANIGGTCKSLVAFVDDRAGHDFRYAIDSAKARRELDFEAEVEFETGIENTVDWYLDNEDWWRGVLNPTDQSNKSTATQIINAELVN